MDDTYEVFRMGVKEEVVCTISGAKITKVVNLDLLQRIVVYLAIGDIGTIGTISLRAGHGIRRVEGGVPCGITATEGLSGQDRSESVPASPVLAPEASVGRDSGCHTSTFHHNEEESLSDA